jgi:hypothetical protein
MISAPGTGCWSSSPESKASAGGQLEQPSEVNSSTITGLGAGGWFARVAGSLAGAAENDHTAKVAITRSVAAEYFKGSRASFQIDDTTMARGVDVKSCAIG